MVSRAEFKSNAWRWLKHYCYGCFAHAWNGATQAVYAFLCVAVASTIDPESIPAPDWRLAAYLFEIRYALLVIEYFAKNPIPASLDSQAPFPK